MRMRAWLQGTYGPLHKRCPTIRLTGDYSQPILTDASGEQCKKCLNTAFLPTPQPVFLTCLTRSKQCSDNKGFFSPLRYVSLIEASLEHRKHPWISQLRSTCLRSVAFRQSKTAQYNFEVPTQRCLLRIRQHVQALRSRVAMQTRLRRISSLQRSPSAPRRTLSCHSRFLETLQSTKSNRI